MHSLAPKGKKQRGKQNPDMVDINQNTPVINFRFTSTNILIKSMTVILEEKYSP